MFFDYPNPEEVGKEDGLEVYEKVWGSSASELSITMPQTFRVGYLLESLRLRQDRAVDILKICAPMWPWTVLGLTRASAQRIFVW